MAGSKVGERVVIQYSGNGITHSAHHMLDRTLGLIRVRTIAALLVGRFADAADWCERAVENAYNLTKCNVSRLLDKSVSSFHPSTAGEKPGSFEGEKNLLQEFNRNVLTSRDVMTLQSIRSMNPREFKKGPEPVFAFLR